MVINSVPTVLGRSKYLGEQSVVMLLMKTVNIHPVVTLLHSFIHVKILDLGIFSSKIQDTIAKGSCNSLHIHYMAKVPHNKINDQSLTDPKITQSVTNLISNLVTQANIPHYTNHNFTQFTLALVQRFSPVLFSFFFFTWGVSLRDPNIYNRVQDTYAKPTL